MHLENKTYRIYLMLKAITSGTKMASDKKYIHLQAKYLKSYNLEGKKKMRERGEKRVRKGSDTFAFFGIS